MPRARSDSDSAFEVVPEKPYCGLSEAAATTADKNARVLRYADRYLGRRLRPTNTRLAETANTLGLVGSSPPTQAVAAWPWRDPLRPALRCRFAGRSSIATDQWCSVNSAHRTHLTAKRFQVALLSGDRADLAMASHSAANLRNFSDGFIGPSSLVEYLTDPTWNGV